MEGEILHSGRFIDRKGNGIKVTFRRKYVITVTPAFIEASGNAENHTVKVWSNMGSAVIKSASSGWISYTLIGSSTVSGHVENTYRISVTANNTGNTRQGSLTVGVSGKTEEEYIRVKQKVKESSTYDLYTSTDWLDFDEDGETKQLAVWSTKGRAYIQSADEDWISYSQTGYEPIPGSSYNKYFYNVTVGSSDQERSGEITVGISGVPLTTIMRSIIVHQDAEIEYNLSMSQDTFNVSPGGGAFYISVWSTTGEAYMADSSEWMTYTLTSTEPISGSDYHKRTYYVTYSLTSSSRRGVLRAGLEGVPISVFQKEATVIQSSYVIYSSVNSLTFDGPGGTTNVSVWSTTGEAYLISLAEWMTVSMTSYEPIVIDGRTYTKYNYAVTAEPASETRDGYLMAELVGVPSGQASLSIPVSQEAMVEHTIYTSMDSARLSLQGGVFNLSVWSSTDTPTVLDASTWLNYEFVGTVEDEGFTKFNYRVTVPYTSDERQGVVKVGLQGVSETEIYKNIYVYQVSYEIFTSMEEINFPEEGGTQEISIWSGAGDAYFNSLADWLTCVETGSQTMEGYTKYFYDVTAGTADAPRTGYLMGAVLGIPSSELSKYVPVSQEAHVEYVIHKSKDEVTLSYDTTPDEVGVWCEQGQAYIYSESAWLNVTKTGEKAIIGSPYLQYIYTLTPDFNSSTSPRTTRLTILIEGVPASEASDYIDVTQEGSHQMTIWTMPTSISSGLEGKTVEVRVWSEDGQAVLSKNLDWVSFTKTGEEPISGSDYKVYVYQVTIAPGIIARMGNQKVVLEGIPETVITKYITIAQL